MNFERIMNWLMNKLTIYLMWFVGVGLIFIVGVQFGIHKGKHLQIEDFKLQIAKMKNELTEVEVKIEVLEERLKEAKIISKIIQCESSGRHNIYGDGGRSFGIAQFQKATFYWLAGKSGLKGLKWKDRDDQIKLLTWAVQNNHGHLWSCYKKLKVMS